jgi:hypothetical protein
MSPRGVRAAGALQDHRYTPHRDPPDTLSTTPPATASTATAAGTLLLNDMTVPFLERLGVDQDRIGAGVIIVRWPAGPADQGRPWQVPWRLPASAPPAPGRASRSLAASGVPGSLAAGVPRVLVMKAVPARVGLHTALAGLPVESRRPGLTVPPGGSTRRADISRAARQSRPGRLLDLNPYQLASPASLPARLGRPASPLRRRRMPAVRDDNPAAASRGRIRRRA